MNNNITLLIAGASTLLLAGTEPVRAADAKEPAADLGTIEVVGESPLTVTGVPVDKIPSPVQTVTSKQLDETQSIALPDYMRRFMGSVNVNDVQNNPFQPDVQFRGFTASPLLGLPQGLAVYLNGIRFNEPFGDTVNWDLIPEGAIERMDLHSGSNAVFGLNSLGGAIAMRTKTGFSAPGHHLELSGGSWGRHSQEITSGWNDGTFGYFVDVRSFEEDGWRERSPTDVKQGLGTFSWRDDRSSLDLTLSGNDNELIGNGAVPVQLYRQDRNAVFTYPDRTETNLFLASLNGSTWLTDHLELSGNAYFRQNRVHTFNGDDSDFEECEDPEHEGLLCEEEGDGEEVALDVNGNPIAASDAVEGGTNNTSATNQNSYGGSIQAAFEDKLFGMNNRLVGGGSYDEGHINFQSDTELASLTSSRGTLGSGIFVDESRVRVKADVRHHGVYLSDTLSVTDQLTLTAAGRYNLSFVDLNDRYGTELNGSHRFDRVNPSGGLTYTFMPELAVYGNYSESNRAPTPVELTCANPDAPCKLPNAFVADPPLKQVVAKTWESGFRGRISKFYGGNFDWNAGLFQTENHNDIIFISSGRLANQGYFDNVGKTRRRGIELGLKGEFETVRFGINYTLLDATFRTPFTANTPNNPKADENGATQVAKRDRVPGLPRHMLKVFADWEIFKGFVFGANMVYNSNQYFRGDEANLNKPVPEYAVFNLQAEYRYNEHFAIFGRFDNIFDKRYQTFGLYGEADEVLGPQYNDPRFIGVGAPRAGWVGVKLSL
jgi:iron complex outermembrane receptor protein